MTTLYACLLETALEEEPTWTEEPLAQGVARLVASRARLEALGGPGGPAPAAPRARASLDYDLCLIRLCGRLGVEHHFFSGMSFDAARGRTEDDLMVRLPALVDALYPPVSHGSHQDPSAGSRDTQQHQENR